MRASNYWRNQDAQFWAYVRVLSEKRGYAKRGADSIAVYSLAECKATLGELGRELVRVERRQRVLVLQLGGQKGQERLEIGAEARASRAGVRGSGIGADGVDHGSDFHIDAGRRLGSGGPDRGGQDVARKS